MKLKNKIIGFVAGAALLASTAGQSGCLASSRLEAVVVQESAAKQEFLKEKSKMPDYSKMHFDTHEDWMLERSYNELWNEIKGLEQDNDDKISLLIFMGTFERAYEAPIKESFERTAYGRVSYELETRLRFKKEIVYLKDDVIYPEGKVLRARDAKPIELSTWYIYPDKEKMDEQERLWLQISNSLGSFREHKPGEKVIVIGFSGMPGEVSYEFEKSFDPANAKEMNMIKRFVNEYAEAAKNGFKK